MCAIDGNSELDQRFRLELLLHRADALEHLDQRREALETVLIAHETSLGANLEPYEVCSINVRFFKAAIRADEEVLASNALEVIIRIGWKQKHLQLLATSMAEIVDDASLGANRCVAAFQTAWMAFVTSGEE